MTDENRSILRKDIEYLLSEEYGSSWRILKYDPRPNATTGIFGITLSVEVNSVKAWARKSSNNEVMEEIKKQISASLPILEKHYL